MRNHNNYFGNSKSLFYISDKGYSIVETMVSVIILGVLASIAIPNFTTTIERTKSSEGIKILSSLLTAQRTYFAENQSYASLLTDLDITISTPDNFSALDDSSVDNDPSALAEVQRTSGEYALSIDSDGDITCDDGTGTICEKLGY